MGYATVKEPVASTVGSITLIEYSPESGPVRVMRSMVVMLVVDGCKGPGEPGTPALVSSDRPLKFVVSITRVFPSQCPRDSPSHSLIAESSLGNGVVGMIRASCAISTVMMTKPGDCVMRIPLL